MAISKDDRLSSDREALKADFLARSGFGEARREPLSGDASTRRYERLHTPEGLSFIFMDQPPAAESQPCPTNATPQEREALGYNAQARLAAGKVEAFVACAGYLRSRGLSAPAIATADAAAGLAILEDLGDDLYARLIEEGQDEAPLYDAAIDALSVLHAEAPPPVLEAGGCSWPLLDYDEVALKIASDLFVEWLPKFNAALHIDEAARREWDAVWAPVLQKGAQGASVFCHRDYHAENLIWLGKRAGPARVGLLDFQDAVRAHPVWDLSMLLHDARRDVSAEREATCLQRYFELNPHLDQEQVRADYAALGALNIVRILGIFSRLVIRDGKPRYAAFMPRLWGYLDRCLQNPALADLQTWLDRHVPGEARR